MKANVTISYEVLNLSDIKIPPYQREVGFPRAKKIAKEFNDLKKGVLKVSFRDGSYWAVDGQHRLVSLKMQQIKSTMCEVITGLTYDEEAELFDTQDENKRPVEITAKFKSWIEREDPSAIAIKKVCENNGFVLAFDKMNGNNKIVAMATLKKIYDTLGYDDLDDILQIIRQAWSGEQSACSKDILSGLHTFIKLYKKDINIKELICKLNKISPSTIITQGRSDLTGCGQGGTKFAKAIFNVYNKGMSESKRLPNKF